jgi:hypothetical protein
MAEQAPEPAMPSAKRLLRRLAVPLADSGTESAIESDSPPPIEAMPEIATDDRLAAARDLLRRLAEGRADIDETLIDRMIADAETALRKLGSDGEDAELTDFESAGLEAVIEADGSRPVLFIRNNQVDLNTPQLAGDLAARWRDAALRASAGIARVAAAVGAVQLPAFDKRRIGTAFAIAPGLVITNRHVLEEFAAQDGQTWTMTRDAEVDFIGEHDDPRENRFKVASVVLAGPNPINRRINFANLDLAILQLEGDLARFPKPVSVGTDLSAVRVGAIQPAVYVMGFPARPLVAAGTSGAGAPAAGSEYQDILDKLYENRFGSKRWSPGLLEAGPGQLSKDARKWVMSHDASTLGGNSGSCVVDLSQGERIIGLHFGGRPRVENFAHVIAALREELKSIQDIDWI